MFLSNKLVIYRSGNANSNLHQYYTAFLTPGEVSPRNLYITKLLIVLLEKSGLLGKALLLKGRIILLIKFPSVDLGRNLVENRMEKILG